MSHDHLRGRLSLEKDDLAGAAGQLRHGDEAEAHMLICELISSTLRVECVARLLVGEMYKHLSEYERTNLNL